MRRYASTAVLLNLAALCRAYVVERRLPLFDKTGLLRRPAPTEQEAQTILEQLEIPIATATTKTSQAATTGRLAWRPEGHNTWNWKGHEINYIEMGDPSKPALLLIHGFGVSHYHFRHNLPELAKNYHVYAFDMLGFGCSSMPIQDYAPEVWRDQTVDFVQQVIGKPTALAGNSLGGLAALYAAASSKLKPLVSSCILMNAALRFRTTQPEHALDGHLKNLVNKKCRYQAAMRHMCKSFQRILLGASFEYSKQAKNLQEVLHYVYPVNNDNVDEELMESILHPSRGENAAEIYCRVLSKNGPCTQLFANDLLEKLECPLMLCWGSEDPWFTNDSCDKIQALYDQTTRVDIHAGHCAHDEAPEEVNSAIHAFLSSSL